MFSSVELAARTDLVLWKPAAVAADIEEVCSLAVRQGVRAVCVAGSRVELAAARLEGSDVKTVALSGFPLGTMDGDVKRFEAETAIDHGAQEIEMMLNHGSLRDGDTRTVLRELRDIAEAAEERPVCVVLQPGWLTRDELVLACHLVLDSGVHAMCAGTGYATEAVVATAETAMLREALGPKFGLKVADLGDGALARELLEAGATRIGTSHFGLFGTEQEP